jgi:hypothetical protein
VEPSQSLYARYIASRDFVASLEAMAALLEDALTADFTLEPRPLQTIAIVCYTSTRLWDDRPLRRMGKLARLFAEPELSRLDQFRLHYALVAAGEEDGSVLREYLDLPGMDGFRATTRTASLAYYLRNEELLYDCVRAMQEALHQQAVMEPDLEWELEFSEAMYSALKCGKADLVTLCRTASSIGNGDHLSFVSTDVNVLQRSISRSRQRDSGS